MLKKQQAKGVPLKRNVASLDCRPFAWYAYNCGSTQPINKEKQKCRRYLG